MSNKPKVSIVSISYNQEKYVKEALKGFVQQKTKFSFEVIIGDDCSLMRRLKLLRITQKHIQI